MFASSGCRVYVHDARRGHSGLHLESHPYRIDLDDDPRANRNKPQGETR